MSVMWEVARVPLTATLNSARELGSDTPAGGRPGVVIGPSGSPGEILSLEISPLLSELVLVSFRIGQ